MPKCPKCKVEIEYLYYEARKIQIERGTFDGEFKDDGGLAGYDEEHELDLKCPECDEILFDDECEANEFLKE